MLDESKIRTHSNYFDGIHFLGPIALDTFNGYAITCFDSPFDMYAALEEFTYIELFKCVDKWKIGTTRNTSSLISRFQNQKPKSNPEKILFHSRLGNYKSDTLSGHSAQCTFLREHAIPMFRQNDALGILMIPLIVGFSGKSTSLEIELTRMIKRIGGKVINDKEVLIYPRAERTVVYTQYEEKKVEKKLRLSEELEQSSFSPTQSGI